MLYLSCMVLLTAGSTGSTSSKTRTIMAWASPNPATVVRCLLVPLTLSPPFSPPTPAVDLTFKYKYAYHQAQLRNESWAGIFDGVQAQCGVKFGAGGMLEVNMTNFAVR